MRQGIQLNSKTSSSAIAAAITLIHIFSPYETQTILDMEYLNSSITHINTYYQHILSIHILFCFD